MIKQLLIKNLVNKACSVVPDEKKPKCRELIEAMADNLKDKVEALKGEFTKEELEKIKKRVMEFFTE